MPSFLHINQLRVRLFICRTNVAQELHYGRVVFTKTYQSNEPLFIKNRKTHMPNKNKNPLLVGNPFRISIDAGDIPRENDMDGWKSYVEEKRGTIHEWAINTNRFVWRQAYMEGKIDLDKWIDALAWRTLLTEKRSKNYEGGKIPDGMTEHTYDADKEYEAVLGEQAQNTHERQDIEDIVKAIRS